MSEHSINITQELLIIVALRKSGRRVVVLLIEIRGQLYEANNSSISESSVRLPKAIINHLDGWRKFSRVPRSVDHHWESGDERQEKLLA